MIAFILIFICLNIGAYYVVTVYLKHRHIAETMSKSFKGPKKHFLFGNISDFQSKPSMLQVFDEYRLKYGKTVYTRLGPTFHGLLITEANLAEEVLKSRLNLTKGKAYEFTRPWLGQGLLTTDEFGWDKSRKMCRNAFDPALIDEYVEIFNKHAKVLRDKLKKIPDGSTIDIHQFVTLCSLDIICETTMDVQVGAQNDENKEYVSAVREMCRIIAARGCSFLKAFKPYYIFTEDYRKEVECVKVLHSFVEKVIKEKRERRAKEQKESTEGDTPKKTSFLDTLLDQVDVLQNLREEEIRDQVHTFMFAGHDTVSATLSFFLYEIAKYPEVQEEIFSEQRDIMTDYRKEERGDAFEDVHKQDFQGMKVLYLAMREAMRLYPAVPVFTREVTHEFEYNGCQIPKGVVLAFFPYGFHRDPDYFEDPDTFKLRRFECTGTPFSYLPFSVGPRGCIGRNYAITEMYTILSHLIRNFKFEPAEPAHELDLRAEVVLTSKTGLKVKVVQRK